MAQKIRDEPGFMRCDHFQNYSRSFEDIVILELRIGADSHCFDDRGVALELIATRDPRNLYHLISSPPQLDAPLDSEERRVIGSPMLKISQFAPANDPRQRDPSI